MLVREDLEVTDYEKTGAGRHRRPDHLGRSLLAGWLPQTRHVGHLVADGGSPGLGHSVWLPPAGALAAPVFVESELPVWALERIAAQFAPQGGRFGVCHGPGPARSELDPTLSQWAPRWLSAAELCRPTDQPLHLDVALVIADPCAFEPEATNEVASQFWGTLERALRSGGIALVHTHQHHSQSGLIDPAGALVRDATRAGLGYLQHVVLVHTRLLTKPLGAADPAARDAPAIGRHRPVHRRAHTDLLAFTAG